MRQQTCLLQHKRRHLAQIRDGGFVPQLRQLLARHAIAALRLVAQCKERFVTSGFGTGTRYRKHFFFMQIRVSPASRRMGERTVVAAVVTELGEWNEYFARMRN